MNSLRRWKIQFSIGDQLLTTFVNAVNSKLAVFYVKSEYGENINVIDIMQVGKA